LSTKLFFIQINKNQPWEISAMKKLVILLFLMGLASVPASAQIWVGDEPNLISTPAVRVSDPEMIYSGNGVFGCFYFWSTGSGGKDGLAYRKLDHEGKPLGPQKFIFSDADRRISIYEGQWANNHFYVLARVSATSTLHLLKVTENGKLVKRETIRLNRRQHVADSSNMIQHGNKLYFTLVLYEGDDPEIDRSGPAPAEERTDAFLGVVDLTKSNSLSLVKYPKEHIDNYNVDGLAADADYVYITEYGRSYNWDGDISGVYIRSYNPRTGKFGKSMEIPSLADSFYLEGPIYNGKGLLLYSMWDKGLYLKKNTIVVAPDGSILSGPYNTGNDLEWSSMGDCELAGDTGVFEYHDDLTDGLGFYLFGVKGKHSRTIFFEENTSSQFIWDGEVGVSGTHLVCVYGLSSAGAISEGVYSKSLVNPKPLKDKIYFLKVSDHEYGVGKKLVRWSALGGNKVSLKFAGKTVEDLPPAYSYIVDVVGEKPMVELILHKADGTTISKKVKLK
jgi:hypothetical protein